MIFGRVLLEEVIGKEEDVGLPLPQGWQIDGIDIESIEQVFPKAAPLNFCCKIFIGCYDEANIDLYALHSPQSFQLPLLKDSQQLSLTFKFKRPDFVQKYSPGIREFELTGLFPICSCEGPFFVAEKLGLN